MTSVDFPNFVHIFQKITIFGVPIDVSINFCLFRTGKIPESLQQTLIFQRGWFLQTFVPTLLALCEDANHSKNADFQDYSDFIGALENQGLIPASSISSWKASLGEQMANFRSMTNKKKIESAIHVEKKLGSLLSEFLESVQKNEETRVNGLLSEISSILRPSFFGDSDIHTIVENLLNSFCTAFGQNRGKAHVWGYTFVHGILLCNDYVRTHVCFRVKQLVSELGHNLNEAHICFLALVLACFAVSQVG